MCIRDRPEPEVINFDISTGILTAPSGTSVTVTMNSGGSGSGFASINANIGSESEDLLGIGITCWGASCAPVIPGGNPIFNNTDTCDFVMPTGGMVNIVGNHNPTADSDNSNSTSFTITLLGESFSGSINVDNGIPQ